VFTLLGLLSFCIGLAAASGLAASIAEAITILVVDSVLRLLCSLRLTLCDYNRRTGKKDQHCHRGQNCS
jgi:hypothetical protein